MMLPKSFIDLVAKTHCYTLPKVVDKRKWVLCFDWTNYILELDTFNRRSSRVGIVITSRVMRKQPHDAPK